MINDDQLTISLEIMGYSSLQSSVTHHHALSHLMLDDTELCWMIQSDFG
jgi:hypothetical protein